MINNQIINATKEHAIDILMIETFDHIKQDQQERYTVLAAKNARLQKTKHTHFMFDGVVYPFIIPETVCFTTSLHFTLLEELDSINKLLTDSFYQSIKNYFTAVISASCNGIVLTTLLPPLLVDTLKKELKDYYKILDLGVYEPKENTLIHIADIKKYYPTELKNLHSILMDKLLLQ